MIVFDTGSVKFGETQQIKLLLQNETEIPRLWSSTACGQEVKGLQFPSRLSRVVHESLPRIKFE